MPPGDKCRCLLDDVVKKVRDTAEWFLKQLKIEN